MLLHEGTWRPPVNHVSTMWQLHVERSKRSDHQREKNKCAKLTFQNLVLNDQSDWIYARGYKRSRLTHEFYVKNCVYQYLFIVTILFC